LVWDSTTNIYVFVEFLRFMESMRQQRSIPRPQAILNEKDTRLLSVPILLFKLSPCSPVPYGIDFIPVWPEPLSLVTAFASILIGLTHFQLRKVQYQYPALIILYHNP
jgi:hypothetical protein